MGLREEPFPADVFDAFQLAFPLSGHKRFGSECNPQNVLCAWHSFIEQSEESEVILYGHISNLTSRMAVNRINESIYPKHQDSTGAGKAQCNYLAWTHVPLKLRY
jgi:hypothetical protein